MSKQTDCHKDSTSWWLELKFSEEATCAVKIRKTDYGFLFMNRWDVVN